MALMLRAVDGRGLKYHFDRIRLVLWLVLILLKTVLILFKNNLICYCELSNLSHPDFSYQNMLVTLYGHGEQLPVNLITGTNMGNYGKKLREAV